MNSGRIRSFVRAALVRAVRTAAQTALSVIGVGAVMSDVDWLRTGSAALTAAILSLLTSVAWGIPEADAPVTDERGDD